ncbi:hypothetical protein J6590_041644 [Homalodisca vitripennis]|nr:hypothetical protein J6590_041644 [Homalodisca vitripennis]
MTPIAVYASILQLPRVAPPSILRVAPPSILRVQTYRESRQAYPAVGITPNEWIWLQYHNWPRVAPPSILRVQTYRESRQAYPAVGITPNEWIWLQYHNWPRVAPPSILRVQTYRESRQAYPAVGITPNNLAMLVVNPAVVDQTNVPLSNSDTDKSVIIDICSRHQHCV